MSAQSLGLIAEVDANQKIPETQLDAILGTYSSAWGYAAPTHDKKTGIKLLLTGSTRIPDDMKAKNIQEMKDEFKNIPELVEWFGKIPTDGDDVCLQPFPCLEDDKGNTTLVCFLEGDFDHWTKDDETNHTPEYICYRDKISPLVARIAKLCNGDMDKVMEELRSKEMQDIFEGTYAERGVIYFIADNGANLKIEGGNDDIRSDHDWGSASNSIPEVEGPPAAAEPKEEPKELSLAERRALRQAQKNPPGVHTTDAKPRPVMNQKNTTLSEQRLKDTLNTSTATPPKKGPFLITLPPEITSEDDAKNKFWKPHFGTCPDNWKFKDPKGNWVPSHTAGFPYDKLVKNSSLRAKYNPDGSPKTSSSGFAALDNFAKGKADAPAAAGAKTDAPRSAPPAPRIPVMGANVRDRVIEDIVKLDLKSRKIMSNDEIKATEKKHSSLYAQLGNMSSDELNKMSYEEQVKLTTTYPELGHVWLFNLRTFQMLNKKVEEPKQEAGTEPAEETKELTLAERRALRQKARATA